jgi:hypothetical protein
MNKGGAQQHPHLVTRQDLSSFDYPVRFEGNVAIITVPHRNGMGGNNHGHPIAYALDVITDRDVYETLKAGNARLGVSYAGGRTANQRLLARVRVFRLDGVVGSGETFAFPWIVLGKRPEPGMMADHINGDGLDNRRANLRWVNHTQNMQNRQAWNKYSNHTGVSFSRKTGKWIATVARSFKTRDEAETFSLMIRNAAFGEYARTQVSTGPVPVRIPKSESKPIVISAPKRIKKPKHSAYWYECLREPIHWSNNSVGRKPEELSTDLSESLFDS